jgi:hypothetical protein
LPKRALHHLRDAGEDLIVVEGRADNIVRRSDPPARFAFVFPKLKAQWRGRRRAQAGVLVRKVRAAAQEQEREQRSKRLENEESNGDGMISDRWWVVRCSVSVVRGRLSVASCEDQIAGTSAHNPQLTTDNRQRTTTAIIPSPACCYQQLE